MYPPDYSPSQAGTDIKRAIRDHLTQYVIKDEDADESMEKVCELVDDYINKINTNSNKYL